MLSSSSCRYSGFYYRIQCFSTIRASVLLDLDTIFLSTYDLKIYVIVVTRGPVNSPLPLVFPHALQPADYKNPSARCLDLFWT